MPHRKHVAWNSMLLAYVSSNQLQPARHLFGGMPQRNSTLYLIMINRLSRGWSASDALNMFNSMPCTVRNVVLMIDGLAHNVADVPNWDPDGLDHHQIRANITFSRFLLGQVEEEGFGVIQSNHGWSDLASFN
ncbi:pentatricopeptide repeat-containing protein At2g35030, mitochondrial-like [Nymphaea colorata]|nr:pentatricopeptide repeat-containing protein At2g35030, mitochondrial-like [Nymphaea colorata]